MSTGLIIIGCLCLVVVVVLQIGRVTELATKIRGEEDVQFESNRHQGWIMLLFMIGFMIYCFWTAFHYKNWMLWYGPHESASAHGGTLDDLFDVTLIFTGIVFVLTHIALFWFAFKYRGRKGVISTFIPHDNKLEIIWTAVPAVVMCFLVIQGLVAWNKVMADVSATDEYMEIEGAAQQFQWHLRYPGPDNLLGARNYKLIKPGSNPLGQDWTDNDNMDDFFADSLVVPVGQKIRVRITALDVLHNFYLPHFRVKMDAIPGLPTYFVFTPTITTQQYRQNLSKYAEYQYLADPKDPKSGSFWRKFDYELACAELCGKGHFSMMKKVVVVSQEEYDAWARRQKSWYQTNIRGKADDPNKGTTLKSEEKQLKQDFETAVEKALTSATAADKTIRLANVNFETNSAKLTENSNIELDNLVGVMNKYPNLSIEIAGHTDDQGEDAANLKLSQDRSKAVYDYVVGKGIAASRLAAKGYGETQPLKANDSEQNRAENRRTEFKITKQ